MTEEQAHQFVAGWSRRMITWRARDEIEQLRDLSQSCMGMLCGAVLMGIMALSRSGNSPVWSAMEAIAVPVGGFSLWMVLQLSQAKRALNQSAVSDRKS